MRPHGNIVPIVGAMIAVAVNVAVFLLPIDYALLAGSAYPGAFLVSLIANAPVAIPIPYIPIVARIGSAATMPALVVILAALGSTLGESVTFFVGRTQRTLVSRHPIYERVKRFAQRPLRASVALFVLAAPLDPFFDVAGLAAGAVGLSYNVFFASVFAARLVRFAVVVGLASIVAIA